MKHTTTDLAPELQALGSLLDAQPLEVQEAFQFLLATAMHEAGKFELLTMAEVDGRCHYTLSPAGQVFSVVRPEMDKEMERRVREEVPEMPRAEGLQRPDCRKRFAASRSAARVLRHCPPWRSSTRR